MGNSSSYDPGHEDDPFDGADTLGYRVLGVQPNSPASKAGLVSFLDFLVGAKGKMLLGSGEELEEGEEYDDVDLPALLKEHVKQEIEFLVFNIKSQEARLVKLTPEDDWGGAGLLGVTIRLDNYAGAEERLIRVLTVEPKSPAAVAGLVPENDFILGTTHQTLDSSDSLADLLHDNVDQVVELYVYNTDSDLVRTVVLMPTLSWGGEGLLGAEVGTGYLHRLPAAACKTDGASVERKVRYVNQQPQTKGETESSSTAANGDQKADHSQIENKNKTSVLEYEPQLEMEPAEEERGPPEKSATTEATPPTKQERPADTFPPPPKAGGRRTGGPERTLSAEDVFSRPPSQGSSPVAPLPPPPRMHYGSQTRR